MPFFDCVAGAGGPFGAVYSRTASSVWSVGLQRVAWTVTCTPIYAVPELHNTGLPVLGATYNLDLIKALPTTFALLANGLSDSTWSGGLLPAPLPGTPGCDLLVDPVVLSAVLTSPAGAATSAVQVPNSVGSAVGTMRSARRHPILRRCSQQRGDCNQFLVG